METARTLVGSIILYSRPCQFNLCFGRPQEQLTTVERNAEGIDIVLALDISSSMKAEDLKPNRFEAAREVAKEFIDQRISDRIGLVSFAMQSFYGVPTNTRLPTPEGTN